MSQQIWKFSLNNKHVLVDDDRYTVPMPKGANVLTAQWQETENSIVIWAVVEPGTVEEQRTFILAFTGQDIFVNDESCLEFISTVQLLDVNSKPNVLVVHVFEVV